MTPLLTDRPSRKAIEHRKQVILSEFSQTPLDSIRSGDLLDELGVLSEQVDWLKTINLQTENALTKTLSDVIKSATLWLREDGDKAEPIPDNWQALFAVLQTPTVKRAIVRTFAKQKAGGKPQEQH